MERSDASAISAPDSVVKEWAEQAQKAVDAADHSQTASIQQAGFTKVGSDISAATEQQSTRTDSLDEVLHALHPLHALLGEWDGVTTKAYGGFKAIDRVSWNWDFQTDRTQPALVMTSDASPYVRKGRLTYLVGEAAFEFQVEDPHGEIQTYRSSVSADRQQPSDASSPVPQAYQLELTQVSENSGFARQQILLIPQTSDQYRMEFLRESEDGKFRRFDVVETHRAETRSATRENDQEQHTCIVSLGPAIIPVTYQGQSYWVCSTGCQAAFEDSPEWWIARFQARNKRR